MYIAIKSLAVKGERHTMDSNPGFTCFLMKFSSGNLLP